MSAVFDPRSGGLPLPLPLHVPLPAPSPAAPQPPVAIALASAPARPGARGPSGASRRGTGLAVVVAVHVLLGWALASGLAQHVVDIVRKPIEMSIVAETPPP